MAEKALEVFQELRLRGAPKGVSIRDCILKHVAAPWHHDTAREEEMQDVIPEGETTIALVRESFNGIDESALVLWQEQGEYRVTNIVPRNVGELGIPHYNAILQDFVKRVAEPAARACRLQLELTNPIQSIDDWVKPEVADALRLFSHLANKSTGASHPRDRDRWFDFLIAAHRTSADLDPSELARWLEEVEGWSNDKAFDLAIDYEFSRDLLRKYDGDANEPRA